MGGNSRGVLLSAAMLGSGLALVVSIVSGLPLWLSLGLLGTSAVLLVALRWARAESADRHALRAQLLVGTGAGLAATAAYDASRALLVHFGRLPLSPFEAFGIFGQLIVGDGRAAWLTYGVGTAYHMLNGTAFAIGYCFLLGGRNWKWGVAWGLGLEAAMLTLYPGWLQLDAVLPEFTTMSFVGHILYGTVLGIVSERWLGPLRGVFASRKDMRPSAWES